ncbi:MAG: hypothetical protein V7K37_12475 [Nostoc sp.]
MTRCSPRWCWKLALGSWLVMGSAIGDTREVEQLPLSIFSKNAVQVGAKTWQGKNLDYGKSNAF